MFWSGNFMAVRELNFLLKEENVTLASVLEADDILQECKADNKALIQFLTRPDILAELITLITEEPPKNVELAQQYRHASIACEVLTSHLSTLSDRLTLDTAQMNRLCDFINRDPPLNPLLASYFSKTVEMLLERSPKQDWYLYHIVCLRVLDFFKSRRDFLPNLLRHISTSAIADTFKYLIRLDDLFNKPIMEWLEQHQFIDSLIQIICGTYVPEHFPAPEEPEKGQREASEKELGRDGAGGQADNGPHESPPSSSELPPANRNPLLEELSAEERRTRAERATVVAAANAAALLCDLVATGCAGEGCSTRSRTAWQLACVLGGGACVRGVLCHVFTCRPRHRAMALHHAARLLQALLQHHTSDNEEERCSVELAVAPHLPLLHQALLLDPAHYALEEEGVTSAGDGVMLNNRVGSARVSIAALIAQLALSEVEEVNSTLLTLGTPGVLVELMFEFPQNNFLHAQVLAFCRHALQNRLYRTQYARHLFMECQLLTRLMDAFEDNEHSMLGSVRAGYMGHVVLLLGCVSAVLEELAEQLHFKPALLERWYAFREERLCPVLLMHDTPLGGTYPSDNTYEVGEELDNISDALAANYDFSDMAATANMDDLGDDDLPSDHEMRNVEHEDSAQFIAAGLGLGLEDPGDKRAKAQSSFLELASQRFDDDMWDEVPERGELGELGELEELGELREEGGAPLAGHSADLSKVWTVPEWERGGGGGGADGGGGSEARAGGEGWAQFDAFAAPPDAFASPQHKDEDFAPFWPAEGNAPDSSCEGLEQSMRSLRLGGAAGCGSGCVELANHLLTAMSAMSPDAIANIVNANLQPLPLEPAEVTLPSGASEVSTPVPVTPPAEFSNASAQMLPTCETRLCARADPAPAPAPAPPAPLHCASTSVSSPADTAEAPPAPVTPPAEFSNPRMLPSETPSLPVDTLPAEVTSPGIEAADSGNSQDKTATVNCVSPAEEASVALKSSKVTENDESASDGRVNDLSARDRVSTAATDAADTAAEVTRSPSEVTRSPSEVTDISER